MLGLCACTCLIGIALIIYVFVNSYQTKHSNLRQLRENHFNRKAKWLPTPFAIGLPKPRGIWRYNPSHKIANNICPGTFIGRQIWTFHEDEQATESEQEEEEDESFDANRNPNSSDKPLRNQLLKQAAKSAQHATTDNESDSNHVLDRALNYYLKLQNKPDGFFGGDYGGPMFLLPGLVIACFISKYKLSDAHKYYMIKYLLNHQQIDGGWGLHIEAPSSMFTTVLNYVTLRMLGLRAEHKACKLALKFITDNDIFSVPAWCKWYLCILNIFHYKAMEFTIPCELWLLPKKFIFHPKNLWCHCRMVYLPMSFLYSMRFKCEIETYPLIAELREELLPNKFEKTDWSRSHFYCNKYDQIVPIHWIAKVVCKVLYFYEWTVGPIEYFRKWGNEFAIDYIENEDLQTNWVNIGPVNKALNLISVYFHFKDDKSKQTALKRHQLRLLDYLWLSEDGMKMQGYNGSHLWDTSFALEAIYEYHGKCNNEQVRNAITECLKFGLSYLEQSQIVTEVENPKENKYFRCQQLGAWPFSNRDHGWPITDCTSQGLKCTLLLQQLMYKDYKTNSDLPINKQRVYNAIDCILNWHNADGDGGWSTYERNRGYNYYEIMNPSQVFMNIMIDYSHIECTSSCIQALCLFKKYYGNYRDAEIDAAIRAGLGFLKKKQDADGKFIGFWAVCCCYAIWFAAVAFKMTQDMFEDIDNRKNMKLIEEFLMSKQNEDGGWGESYLSCIKQDYVPSDKSQVINTAWALISLLEIESEEKVSMEKAKELLVAKQLRNGDWPQEEISGLFNHTCMISYSNYRNIFPIWALAKYNSVYGDL